MAAAVAALMILSPASAIVITHPYYKLGSGTNLSIQKYGCSTAKSLHALSWGKKSGVFKAAGEANSPSCSPSSIPNQGFWEGGLELTYNTVFTTATAHTINATWKFNFVQMWNLTPYSHCKLNYSAAYSSCVAFAEPSIFAFTQIWDQTNSSWGPYGFGFAQGSFLDIYNYSSVQNYSQNYCYGGTCTHFGNNYSVGGNGTNVGTMFANLTTNLTGTSTVNAGDTYQIAIYLYIMADSGAYTQGAKGFGKASAFALNNLGTGALGAQLLRLAIV